MKAIQSLTMISLLARSAHALQRSAATSARRQSTLITFDVDGTLVHGSGKGAEAGAHARAFAHAVGAIFSPGGGPTRLPADTLKPERYHGSTDGLIALNMAREALSVEPAVAFPKLPDVFRAMHDYVKDIEDEEFIIGLTPLPGVVPALVRLQDLAKDGNLLCGLVTGNIEGIARKKMRATGILATGVLSPAASDQCFDGENDSTFLGGFGSDYCSGDIDDLSRNHKDRGQQIAIAYKRAQGMAASRGEVISRVVHVGDAPGDVLGAKYCAEAGLLGDGVVVKCIAVGTGRYSPGELTRLCGDSVAGKWEFCVLPEGLADGRFIGECVVGKGAFSLS